MLVLCTWILQISTMILLFQNVIETFIVSFSNPSYRIKAVCTISCAICTIVCAIICVISFFDPFSPHQPLPCLSPLCP